MPMRIFVSPIMTGTAAAWVILGIVAPGSGRGESPRPEVDPPATPAAVRRAERLVWRDLDALAAQRLTREAYSEEALIVSRRVLDAQRELLGDSPEDVAGALELVAHIARQFARFEESAGAFREALDLRTRARGPDDWRAVDARYALERVERLIGLDEANRESYRSAQRAFARAVSTLVLLWPERIALAREALPPLKAAVGEADPEYAHGLDRLATFLVAEAPVTNHPQRVEARELGARSRAIRQRALGGRHPDYARSLEDQQRDSPRTWDARRGQGPPTGEELLWKALEIREATQGPDHPDCARTLERLASHSFVTMGQGQNDAAIGLYQRSIEVYRRAYGPDSLELNSPMFLARKAYSRMRRRDLIEASILETVRIMRSDAEGDVLSLPIDRSSIRLGPINTSMEPLEDRSPLAVVSKRGTRRRRHLADALAELGQFEGHRGNKVEAGRLLREALEIEEEFAGASPKALATLGQLANVKPGALYKYLDLSLDPGAAISPEEAYRHLLFWKGENLATEVRVRSCRDQPELIPLFAELDAVSSEVGRFNSSPAAPADSAGWLRLYASVRRQHELEVEIAARASRLDRARAGERADLDRLRANLPPGVALIDFFRGTAFVIRGGMPVVRLGWSPPGEFGKALGEWTAQIRSGGDTSRSGATVRKWLWEPLETHLGGVHTVLISPDHVLSGLPFAALPGRAPGSYLIHDFAIAVVPSPQMLRDEAPLPASAPSLLLVGDVDFDAGPGVPPAGVADPRPDGGKGGDPARSGRRDFAPLPGTRREVEAIAGFFAASHPGAPRRELRGPSATERAFRESLPGARYIHVATHGFYLPPPPSYFGGPLPPGDPENLPRISEGLDAAIVFAGANRPRAASDEDGMMTSLEARQLDLKGAELLILSACETSLGRVTSDEGTLGLHRAFHAAGVRSVISSLWAVDDAATSVLMEEFYGNLWRKKLGPLESLRRAQLAVMDDPDRVLRRSESLAADLRGLNPKAQRLPTGVPWRRRSPPTWWAGFMLSGDVR